MVSETEATKKILDVNAPKDCPRGTGKIDDQDSKFGTAKLLSEEGDEFAMKCTGCINVRRFDIKIPQNIPATHGEGIVYPACIGCPLKEENLYEGGTGVLISSEENKN